MKDLKVSAKFNLVLLVARKAQVTFIALISRYNEIKNLKVRVLSTVLTCININVCYIIILMFVYEKGRKILR